MRAPLFPLLAVLLLQDAEALLKTAGEKLAKQDFKGAGIDFTKALELDPTLPEAWLGRGKVFYQLDDYSRALADLNQAVQLDPGSADVHFWRGIIRQEMKDFKGAIADYDRAVELGGARQLLLERRGNARAILGDYEGAVSDLDLAIGQGARTSQGYSNRAFARLVLLDPKGTLSDATRALRLDPVSGRSLSNRAVAYYTLRSWENSVRDLRKIDELSGSRADWTALWTWTARSRMGQTEEASKELREFRTSREEPADARGGKTIAFLLDEVPEAEFLKWAEETAQETAICEARFFAGTKRLLDGDEAAALRHFERAAASKARDEEKPLLARAQIEMIRLEQRRRLTRDLEEKFRALKPFRAELKATGMDSPGNYSISSIVLSADLAGGRLVGEMRGRDHKKDRDLEAFIAVEGLTIRWWGLSDQPIQADLRPFLGNLDRIEGHLFEEMDRILPGAKRDDGKHGPTLVLNLEAKPSKDQEGTLRFAFGRGISPASWLQEPRKGLGVILREDKDALVFEIPALRKTTVVDRETGFLRSIRVLDFDGTVRELSVVSFRHIESFPEPRRPEKFESIPAELGQILSQMKEQHGYAAFLLEEALERWETVTRERKEGEVRALFTRWAARYLETLRTWLLRSMARSYIRRELDRGVPLADLFKDVGGEAKRFRESFEKHADEVTGLLKSRLAESAFEIETQLIERPIDSRRHGTLGKFLDQAFAYDAVEAERARTHGDGLEKAFREELETHKQL